MIELIFYVSIALLIFAYFGYPLSLMILGLVRKRTVVRYPSAPLVTFIIAGYNEERRIREKLVNTLDLKYPKEKLQIIVASDGSTDGTNDIVREFEGQGLELLALEERRGKEFAQKAALEKAKGDILVFSDVATRLNPDGLRQMVSNFADPTIGCVSSEDRMITQNGQPSGENLYVRYEMWLRRLESRVHSVVGLSGSFFAARREVCADFSTDMPSDFRTLLNCIRMGLRGVSDPRTMGYYLDLSVPAKEFERKVRTVLRGFTVFFRSLEFLNITRYGFFAYEYFSHKLLRWLVPFFLILIFLTNAVLAFRSMVCLALFLGQMVFYGAAIWAWKQSSGNPGILVKIPLYFVMVNTSIALAWWRYLKGERVVLWTPSRR